MSRSAFCSKTWPGGPTRRLLLVRRESLNPDRCASGRWRLPATYLASSFLIEESRKRRNVADNIRVGIVGATVTKGGSGWGADAHVPALKALPNYELKAICTSHEDTAKASKEIFNIELAFHNIKDMVAHPDIDLIAVVVRVPDHAALVEAAVNAGKDV